MEEKEVKEKKEKVAKESKSKKKMIVPKTATKGLINGFIAYGIMLMFIFLSLVVVVVWFVDNHKESINYDVLKYTLPALGAFIIFFLIRATCRLSTFDLFKNCRVKKDEVDGVCRRMKFFYAIVIIFSIFAVSVYMIVDFSNARVDVMRDLINYSQSNSYYAREKETEIIKNFEETRTDNIIQTMIIEAGIMLGIFSIMPSQKKLIERYN